MKDIFEDLMYHAGMTAQGCWDEFDDYQREAVEQYGRLVVQECIKVCQQTQHPASNPETGQVYADLLREHFNLIDLTR